MPSKSDLPKQIIKEIDLFSFLNSFPHLAKQKDYRMKGVGSTRIRMSHSGMSFGKYYEHLKSYSGIADVELKPPKKRLFRPETPWTITIFDKIGRDIYLQDRVDSSAIRLLISKYYTLATPKAVEKIIQSIPDGEYVIDRNLSLREDERFQRKRYRYLFLYSTGGKVDLKNCMLAYQLSSEEIIKALKCGVWVTEETKEEDAAEEDRISQELNDAKKRLVLKRFDIHFTLKDLRRVVWEKAQEPAEHSMPQVEANMS